MELAEDIKACRKGGYEGSGEAAGKPGMMQRMGSGALSPKGIIQSISAKGGELMQGRRGQGFLNNDVRPCRTPSLMQTFRELNPVQICVKEG